MSGGFVKVYGTILDSSVWGESPPTKVVWITLLAMADARGFVEAAVPGLARRAAVSIAEVETALAIFMAPDPYSKDHDHEGRRVEPVDGGWRLLNYQRYREMRTDRQIKDAERQERYRDKAAKGVTERDMSHMSREASASASPLGLRVNEPISNLKRNGRAKQTKLALVATDPKLDEAVTAYLIARAMRLHDDVKDAQDYGRVADGTRSTVTRYMAVLRERGHPLPLLASLPALTDLPGLCKVATVLLRTGEHARVCEDGVTRGATCHAEVIDSTLADQDKALSPRQVEILRNIGTADYVKARGAYAKEGW